MHADHPSFKAPPNPDGKIWQYMDLAQFVSMLQRKQLFFVKANQLRDPYEGTMPQHNNNNVNNLKPPSAYEGERDFQPRRVGSLIATPPRQCLRT